MTPAGATGTRPCWVEISEPALRANWRVLRSRLSKNIHMLAVVKADGYGLGILNVAKIAIEEGAAYLGVSSVEEGISIRKAGHKIPVLILGSLYPFECFPLLFQHHLTPTIASLEAARALSRIAEERKDSIPVHLKIDSGFGRIGVSLSSAVPFIESVKRLPGIAIEGLYTHFASSDVDPTYTRAQNKAFLRVVGTVRARGIMPRYVHMANSSAIIRYPETHGTLVRPGIAFYGVPPFKGALKKVQLKRVVTWKSRVVFLKTVSKGSSVSYARSWKAKRKTRVATLAVGYADGLPRLLSNTGEILIHGRRAPIIGRVTMDMTMVDVTDHPHCRIGDEAILLGVQGKSEITALDIATWARTNAYEVLCGIGARVPRLILHG